MEPPKTQQNLFSPDKWSRLFTALALTAICLETAFTGLAAADDERVYAFGTTVVSTSGLQGRIFHIKENSEKLPKLDKKKSVGTIYTNRLNVWPQQFDQGFPGITDRFEWFALDYTGRFWVDNPGRFRFSLLSDDGARLRIDDKELIDNDNTHAPSAVSASAFLSRGIHRIHVSYFQGPRFTVALVLAVAPPDSDWRIFNTDDFLPPKDPTLWVDGSISEVRHSVDPNTQR